jgi:hypothetical protein
MALRSGLSGPPAARSRYVLTPPVAAPRGEQSGLWTWRLARYAVLRQRFAE